MPGELAIVGYDDIEFAGAAAVPLSSVRQPRELLGRTATELLLAETRRQRGARPRAGRLPPGADRAHVVDCVAAKDPVEPGLTVGVTCAAAGIERAAPWRRTWYSSTSSGIPRNRLWPRRRKRTPAGIDPRSAVFVSTEARICPPWAALQIRDAVLTTIPT